ncbi:MAG: threonine ammonia-lyase [Candidatus Puniceispirillales bacterium]
MTITPDAIRKAAKEMEGNVIRTPTLASPALSKMADAEIFLKLENLQHTSSFKARGAFTKMQTLTAEQRKNGVITMSAGNHAQAVAYHAHVMGVPAVIAMPSQTPFAKINRTRAWGAEIVLEGRNLNECEGVVEKISRERNMTLVHPYNDLDVATGQGSVGLEMLEDCPDLDTIVVPIGGGGLMAGIATIARSINPDIRIIGVEAKLWPTMTQMIADTASTAGGETIAEGIAVKHPGDLTKPIVEALVDEIVLVDEDMIERAVSTLVEQQRVVAEGAGAAGIAALLQYPEMFKGHRCGIVICGGNIDPRLLAGVLNRSMAKDGRIARLRIGISDEPGTLAAIATAIGNCKGNIVEIFHQRMFHDVPAKLAKIDAVVETRGGDHVDEIIAALQDKGFTVNILAETESQI